MSDEKMEALIREALRTRAIYRDGATFSESYAMDLIARLADALADALRTPNAPTPIEGDQR
jgi:hypothetical protein